jgi:hypothetical protein
VIQQQFYEENIEMKQEFEGMNQKIFEKNQIIDSSLKIFNDQKAVIKRFNLPDSIPPQAFDDGQKQETIEELKNLISIERSKLDAIKVVNAEYKKESDSASQKAKMADKELEKLIVLQKKRVEKIERIFGRREDEINKETDLIRGDFLAYKNKIEQEMQIRTLLEERQNEFICSLISELKNTKIILQHPTLRLKTYDKLRQSMKTPDRNLQFQTPLPESERMKTRNMLISKSSKISRRTRSSFKN